MYNRKVYIRSALNKDALRTAADRSRTDHLFNLMDDEEWWDDLDYRRSTERYYLVQGLNRYASDFENILATGVAEINQDVKSLIEEYNLYNAHVWVYIDKAFRDTEIDWSPILDDPIGKDLHYQLYDYYGTLKFRLVNNSGTDVYIDFKVIKSKIEFSKFIAKALCELLFIQYVQRHKIFDIEKVAKKGEDILEFVLQTISDIVTDAVEECIEENPPSLN